MRAHFLIAIICLSVVQLPVGSAQIPTAAISLTCDSSDNVSHLYQYSLDNELIDSIYERYLAKLSKQLNKIHNGNKKQVKYTNSKLIPSKPK